MDDFYFFYFSWILEVGTLVNFFSMDGDSGMTETSMLRD